ncbi:MAG: nitroreductase family protein [Pseudonocardiales bacterium]|nr:nitroreductase family protein [Pseudonocardiales bacterium]
MTATLDCSDLLTLPSEAQDLLFRDARTANTFVAEPVTGEQIQAIYDLVKFAPTSMNIQPLRLVLVRSTDARARLVEHMSDGNKAKTAAAPAVVVLATDVDFHEELPRVYPHFPGAKDLFADEDLREGVARFNAGLQVGYFILGVRAAGLAAGPMGGFDAEAVSREFFPDGRHRALVVVNIGKPGPDAWLDRLPRLDFDEVATTV